MSRSRTIRLKSNQSRSAPLDRRHGHGFTLIEMVLVIILVGIVFSMGSVMLGKVFSSYSAKQDIADADWQAKVALERIARELRAVRTPTAADLDVASTAQVRFIDTDGNGVCFYRNAGANRIMRSADGPATACGTTSPQILADNATALAFSYWTSDGAATAVTASVYYITVDMTIVEGVYSSSFRTNVRPRNF
ncbi:MAG TPA: type II secretion system protein [Sulfuricaulis sp.]|nr:type II secretion system protein [Sulfuricaulis sp.]